MNKAPSNQNQRPADDNVIQRFQLEQDNKSIAPLRGRMVRIGEVLDVILEPHQYPEPVAQLVAETITLALLLSSMLKYEGVFSLQVKGDGPISMLLSDVTSDGVVRGCASFDKDRLEEVTKVYKAMSEQERLENHLTQYLGNGYIVFTVYKSGKEIGYQGIVELKGLTLADCVRHYFAQSEQIGAAIKMAVGRRSKKWRAGGMMLQNMPEDEKTRKWGRENVNEEDWNHAMILMQTCTDDEFLDPDLHSNDLLQRLFNEEIVRVFSPYDIKKGCRCSAKKVKAMLEMMPDDDIEYITEDGKIAVTCEFCSTEYKFDSKKVGAEPRKKTPVKSKQKPAAKAKIKTAAKKKPQVKSKAKKPKSKTKKARK